MNKIWEWEYRGYMSYLTAGTYDSLSTAKKAAELLFNQVQRTYYSHSQPPHIWSVFGTYGSDSQLNWEERKTRKEECHTSYLIHNNKNIIYDIAKYRITSKPFNNFFFVQTIDTRALLTTLCIALQSLRLPSLVLLAIYDEYLGLMDMIPMYKKWEVIKLIRHSRDPGRILFKLPQN